MNMRAFVRRYRAGREPIEVRFLLNKMYRVGRIDYHQYWEAIEITMEVTE